MIFIQTLKSIVIVYLKIGDHNITTLSKDKIQSPELHRQYIFSKQLILYNVSVISVVVVTATQNRDEIIYNDIANCSNLEF